MLYLPSRAAFRAVCLVVTVLALSGGATGRAGTLTPSAAVVPDHVLVGFRAGASQRAINAAEASAGARELRAIGAGTYVLHVAPGDVDRAISSLAASPVVRYAEPDRFLAADQSPNDPAFGNEWGLFNTGQTIDVDDNTSFSGTPGADIKATAAWDVTTGSAANPVVVGIDDTGLYYNHVDLAANAWSDPLPFAYSYSDSTGSHTTTCPAGSHGWDAIRELCDPFDPAYPGGHGTRVAGIIGARGNDGVGVAGVNWNVRLMGLRWDQNSCLCGATADAIEAIDYAVQAKQAWDATGGAQGANVRVLSNSWGCCYPTSTPTGKLPYDPALLDEVRKAGRAGILFVASAGNSNYDIDPPYYQHGHYPCSFDDAQTFGTYNADGSFTPDRTEQALGPATNVVCVASTDYNDNKSSFSNWGNEIVQIAAPGTYIYSTAANGSYTFGSGTSFATPFVSGAAALVLAQSPGLSVAELKQRLVGSYTNEAPQYDAAGNLIAGTGCECGYAGGGAFDQLAALQGLLSSGGGRLNLCKALVGCLPGTPGAPAATETVNGKKRALVVSWAAPTNGGAPSGYRIYRAAGTSSTFTYVGSVGQTTTYKDTAVTIGTSYSYKVSATNYGGEGPQSIASPPVVVK